ncbi:CubicO group peptidase (beta-lactamase class C family) [Diaminobutyricimonas aerilata]|uniref:CubicO group peptidase (Beta-lactamase class C family) n=1 Tax=Diaminobutyricimonas aerilata TaxID=1162967 RepID=A0A2M9CFS3_9MICO|nr:serine hydrolase domain-containing protein [Diaminobutyricimonas aerilata]PJJ70700.1 CubicO group peptidase (beta-lactamase class C family) [Diaminobutyricimonas aerilata]
MSEPFAHAFDWARRQVESGALPTAVLGVATAAGVQALDAFGATGSRAARIDDHYRLFSITKPLVGLAAARMIEMGLATPGTPLQSDVPEFGRNRDDVVRLRHLVSHTSGIAEPPMDTAAGLEAGLLGERDFAAGTASRYSTIAFEGVARMIRARTGRVWDEAVADTLAGVEASGLTLDEASDPHHVVDAADAGLDLQRFAALRHPGAGLLGRAEDLLSVGAALLRNTGEIVRPTTLAMMLRPLTGDIPRLDPYPAERGQDWGFTWNLRTRAPGLIDRDAYGHGGWSGAEFWVHPTVGVAYVLLTNRAERPTVNADELDNAVVSGV